LKSKEKISDVTKTKILLLNINCNSIKCDNCIFDFESKECIFAWQECFKKGSPRLMKEYPGLDKI
jgi:hypothetical protein